MMRYRICDVFFLEVIRLGGFFFCDGVIGY